MQSIFFFTVSFLAMAVVLYLGVTSIMKGFTAKQERRLENEAEEAKEIEKNEIFRPWDILQPQINDEGKTVYHPLHDKGSIGVFLKGFFGYNSNPNVPEVILWICALFFGLNMWRRFYF